MPPSNTIAGVSHTMSGRRAPINVCVTGAAGQIAYSLLQQLARGDVFGHDQPIVLQLLDIQLMMKPLSGVVMELLDCAYPLLVAVNPTTKPEEAFLDADVAILIGAIPRKDGMQRKELLTKNAKIFAAQGSYLDRLARKTCKVLVVGNPANTNCMLASIFAPSIPKCNFTSLTHLDQNRAKIQIALKLGVSPGQIRNVIIWGNHSITQFPDISHAYVLSDNGRRTPLREAINDDAWVEGEFIKTVQGRGQAVITARKLSSAMSAAKAIADHMRVWWHGTEEGEITSMGVVSDGSYDIPEGIVYSHPVVVEEGTVRIATGLEIDKFSKSMMEATADELVHERGMAHALVGIDAPTK